MLSLNDSVWRLKVVSEIETDLVEIAFDDLFNWIKVIYRNTSIPEVCISDSQFSHELDVSISKRWDETSEEPNKIICRTDHFDYFPDSQPVGSTGKDYFNSRYSKSDDRLSFEFLDLKQLLKETFDYDDFNPGQIEIIENILLREDTIGILPTGGGKSLCYQLPAILTSGLTIVVCPIKSLMRDQVQELIQIGFNRAACIDSDTGVKDKNRIIKRVKEGQIRFLFVSPERLQLSNFRESIQALSGQSLINLVVIDEVHCMSEWGHDFRTSYLTLPSTLDTICKGTPKLCLTATASKKVLVDIQNEFSIDHYNVKTLSRYERPNLHFSVTPCNPFDFVLNILKARVQQSKIDEEHAGILFTSYVNGPKGAFNLMEDIKPLVGDVNFFTGSKPKNFITENFEDYKLNVQKAFKDNGFSLLVATKAFGMGVNKKNVYTTIHVGLPQSVESLYQEAGRAGRDKSDSDCFVLFERPTKEAYDSFFNYKDFHSFSKLNMKTNGGDLAIHHFFLKNSIQDNYKVPEIVERILRHLSQQSKTQSEVVAREIGSSAEIVELALYRLFQMGLVQDWTVEDFRKGIYLVDYEIHHIGYHNDIVKSLTDGKGLSEANLSAVDTMGDWIASMRCLADIVVNHHLDTRVHSRIESLKTLLYACDEFDKSNADKFRHEIESYFTIDDINDSLGDVVSSGGDPETIIGYLSGSQADNSILQFEKDRLQARLFPLRRYIESYPGDVGLELINEILLSHIKDKYQFKSLQLALDSYKSTLSDKIYYEFLRDLSGLFQDSKWRLLEQQLVSGIENIEDLDAIATNIKSEKATVMILKKVTPKFKEQARRMHELI